MFTVCPKCALTLVVTAADLRVAQGYVRCGRCLNVFNALARLSETSAAPPSTPETPRTTAQTTPATTPDTAPATAPEQDTAETATQSSLDETGEIEIELDASSLLASTQTRAAPEETAEHEALEEAEPAPEAAAQETSAPEEHSAREAQAVPPEPPPPQETAAGLSPGSTAEADGAADRDLAAAGTLDTPAPPGPDSPPNTAEPPPAAEAAAAETAAPEAVSTEAAADAQQTNSAPEQTESPFEPRVRRSPAGLAWNIAASALVLALTVQVINHYRDALAADPALRGPLSAAYSVFGVKLAPHWNVHAYEVRQLGASVDGAAAGEIIVRASVKNSASRAQPLPLLRVTLQDRFGNRIAARDVAPSAYLPSSAAPSALLAAGGRVDATMAFVDPGPQAVGFEIDACLRQRGGAVACAHGP